eukprot:Lithocolla_globosa_v1_NODE_4098_length_1511_cov_47.152473.p1 type:complete len:472 gc:universal NODE_4098_length_1511_cov_47.152473:1428-13(-)
MQESKRQKLDNMTQTYNVMMNQTLGEADPEVAAIVQHEKRRQFAGLELIASENFTSQAVMEVNGSCLTNKYSEGLPKARYYGGNEYIDQLEILTIQRAQKAFHLDPEEWGVNVQSYSGSTANFNAYTAILKPHDRLMGLDLPSGGHLTHGYQTAKRKVSGTSVYFESMPYQVDSKTGLLDYDHLEKNAHLFRPRLIVCGASAYPRDWDYARFRKIADINESYLLADMAHISGLVATQEAANPFEYCDLVTTTTHKTLRGPRSGLIFFRKKTRDGKPTDLESRVNNAVFPSNQGGPHNNTIGGVCVALKQVMDPEFKKYCINVKANAKALADGLIKRGHKLATDGTDNHLVLWDVRPQGLTGSKVEKVCDLAHITVNKNAVHGDTSALTPGGIRLGTPAMTSRGLLTSDFETVAEFLHRAVEISKKIQEKSGKKLVDFLAALDGNAEIKELAKDVEAFSRKFPMPGFDPTGL